MNERPVVDMAFADDHKMVRAGMKSLIEIHLNHSVQFNVKILAANGKELLSQIAESLLQPHVILLDIRMPEMDGYETMQHLHKRYPSVPVLIYTSIDAHTELTILRMLKLGARGYIVKSAEPAELEKALIDVVNGHIYLPQSLRKTLPGINQHNMRDYLKHLFTDHQIQFLSLCCSELSYKEIGEKMGITERTAQHYAEKIAEHLGVHSREVRVALAICAMSAGLCGF